MHRAKTPKAEPVGVSIIRDVVALNGEANWFEMQLATKNKSKSRTIPRRFRKLRKPSVGPPFERIGDPQIPPTRQNSSVSCPSRRTPEPWRLRCTPELFPVRGLLSGGCYYCFRSSRHLFLLLAGCPLRCHRLCGGGPWVLSFGSLQRPTLFRGFADGLPASRTQLPFFSCRFGNSR